MRLQQRAIRALRASWPWGYVKFAIISATLALLLYAEEDWRGAHLLSATKAKWELQGESFNPTIYVPSQVPDGMNLAALPLFSLQADPNQPGILVPRRLLDATSPDKHGGNLPSFKGKDKLRVAVANAYGRVFPGGQSDPVAQLEALYPVISELHEAAATRPEFRLKMDYFVEPSFRRPLLLVTSPISLARVLGWHALLALDEQRSTAALNDIEIQLQMAQGVGHDPTLVGGLVSIGLADAAHHAIQEGLRLHAFTDPQLSGLQASLTKLDFLKTYQYSLRGELITGTTPLLLEAANRPWRGEPMNLWPPGWFDHALAEETDLMLREVRVVDPERHRVEVGTSLRLEEAAMRGSTWPRALLPWNMLSALAIGPIGGFAEKAARAEVALDECRIACALERFHLAHGVYPESLDVLAPAYIDALPHDIFNGQPYHYVLKSDGTFLLYSVGWNLVDDGGKEVDEPGTTQRDDKQGDWVWQP